MKYILKGLQQFVLWIVTPIIGAFLGAGVVLVAIYFFDPDAFLFFQETISSAVERHSN